MTMPAEAMSHVSASRLFGMANKTHCYQQTTLEGKSQLTTVFITLWSRYKYLWDLTGLNASGNIAWDGLRNTVKVVDDILMFENSFPEHVQQVRQFLMRF